MSVTFPITNDARFRRHTGSGGETVFNIPFPFQDNTDMVFYRVTNGVAVGLLPVVNYSLTGANNPAGGTLTLTSPLLAGQQLWMIANTGLARTTSVTRSGKYSSVATDIDLDRSRLIQQELRRDVGRALKRRFDDPSVVSPDLPLPQGGMLLGWSNDGKIINVENDPASAAASAAAAAAALAAIQALVAGITVQEQLRAPRLVATRTGRYTDVYELTSSGAYLPGAGVSLHNTKRVLQTRSMHRVANNGVRISAIQPVWGNWWMRYASPTVFEMDGTAPIIVRASIYSAFFGGAFLPFNFSGQAEGYYVPGSNLVADPLEVELPPASDFWIMTRAEILDLEGFSSFPVGRICQAAFGEGALAETVIDNDYTVVPGATYPLSNVPGQSASNVPENNDLGFMPCAIIGRAKGNTATVMLAGDSVGDGFGDNGNPANGLQGHLARCLGNSVPWTKFTRPGHSYLNWVNAANHRRMLSAIPGAYTHVYAQLGTNDVYANARSLVQTQQAILSFIGNFADRGVKVILGTIPPVTGSNDGWTTLAGQTITNVPAGANTVRVGVNDWLRAGGIPGLTALFDVADILEPFRNAGIWNPNFTPDGVHIGTVGAQTIENAWDGSLLLAA